MNQTFPKLIVIKDSKVSLCDWDIVHCVHRAFLVRRINQ